MLMVCNGICDSFVMVLEFSVMVLLFFSAGLHDFFIIHLSNFKGCCWPRFVFIATTILS